MTMVSHQCIVKPMGGGAAGPGADIGGGNQTIGTICEVPDDAIWVRFRFTCWSPEDVAVAGAAYAASSQLGDGYAAYDAAGVAGGSLWRPVTFGAGGNSVTQPAVTGERQRGFILPAIHGTRANDFAPQMIISDWLPFNPMPRRDGGAGTLLNIRLHVPAEHPPFRLGYAGAPALNHTLAGSYSFGDNTVPPHGGYSEPFPVSVVHGIDCICGRPTRSLIVVGDSIASGDCSTGAGTSYGLIAAVELAALGHRVSPAILANPGQSSAAYLRNGYDYIAGEIAELGGSVVVIQSWSGNDPQTMAGAEASFRGALALASFCQARGLIPVLATAAPVAMSPEHEAGRAYGNALARGTGLACLDIDRIAGLGGSPNRYKPGLAAPDNVHLADAGQSAVARELVALVRALTELAPG